MITLADIEAARARLSGRVRTSPCAYARQLSEATGLELYFKLENLQMTGSFKERGACNRLLLLSDDERQRGVVAASAGNHAQGVAYHAREMGLRATIVMPRTTPLVKVAETQAFGAEVVMVGGGYEDALLEARRIVERNNSVLIHGFDDPAVVAGQGTIGLEVLEQVPTLGAVVLAIGGGGLAAGVATAIKERRPEVTVFGVQTEAVPSMRAALHEGGPVTVTPAKTIAEGVAIGRVGDIGFEAVRRYVDDVVTVDDEEIAEAILALLEREKTVAEGAGAAPLAAILHRELPLRGKTVVVIVGGGNIDVNVLSRIIDRGLIKTGRITRFRVMVPDVPGSLARILAIVADRQANIVEVEHERGETRLEFGQTSIEITAETRGFEHGNELRTAIQSAGFTLG